MNIKLANRLIDLRKKAGYSQEELADKLGISRQAISKWERAESVPDTDNLITLSGLYGASIDEMLEIGGGNKEIPPTNIKDNPYAKISDSEADTYLKMYKRGGLIIGLGVILVFAAVIALLSLLEFAKMKSLGFIVFFVILTGAVAIILLGAFLFRHIEYIDRTKKLIELTENKRTEMTEKYNKFSPKFIGGLIAGICIILLSVILPVVLQNMLSVILMLACISLGVFLILYVSSEYSVYEKLLNIEKKKL